MSSFLIDKVSRIMHAEQTVPLLRHRRDDLIVAYRQSRPVSAARFLLEVAHAASELPEGRFVVNLCADRYHFAVGLAAALCRKQISLLPPNHTPGLLQSLKDQYPDVYALIDSSIELAGVPAMIYPKPPAHLESRVDVPSFPGSQVAVFAFTSGSTGRPVPHEKTWGGLARSAIGEATRLSIDLDNRIGIVGTVPPQHMYGLESTLLLALQSGGVLHCGKTFYPEDIRAALSELAAPRMLVTTPVHLRALLAEGTMLPPLQLILCATAPLATELAAAAEERFDAPVYEIYGCTEAGQVASRRTVEGPQWRTLPEVKLHQNERGTFAQGGHVESQSLLQDVIELYDDEHFTLHGRTTDMVNVAGKRASLANLNYHLNAIPGVEDGVFFMPEEASDGVTRLAALAVAPGLSQEAILSELRKRLDLAFLPRPLYLVEALPRNSTGKLPRAALDQMVRRLAGKTAKR